MPPPKPDVAISDLEVAIREIYATFSDADKEQAIGLVDNFLSLKKAIAATSNAGIHTDFASEIKQLTNTATSITSKFNSENITPKELSGEREEISNFIKSLHETATFIRAVIDSHSIDVVHKGDIRDARRLLRETRTELENARSTITQIKSELRLAQQEHATELAAFRTATLSTIQEELLKISKQNTKESRTLQAESYSETLKRFESLARDHRETVAQQQKDIDTAIAAITTASDVHIEKRQTEFESTISAIQAEADSLLTKLKGHDKEATDLLGIVGANVTANGFKKEAESAKASMKWWNITAVASIFSMGCWAASLVLFESLRVDTPWGIVGRLAVFTPLFLLAGYAAAQATHARKTELQLRRTALELAALPPFMAPLPDEKSHELLSLMAQRTFGRDSFLDKPGEPTAALLDTVINKDLAPLLLQVAIEALKRQEKK